MQGVNTKRVSGTGNLQIPDVKFNDLTTYQA